MDQTPSVTLIQEAESFGVDTNYFDLQVHLDLENETPYGLRAYSIPIEFTVMMPLAWDKENLKNPLTISPNPKDYFSLTNLEPQDTKLLDNLLIIGRDKQASSYNLIQEIQRKVVNFEWFGTGEVDDTLGNKTLKVSAAKLFLALATYAKLAVEEAEAKDRLELTLDKLLSLVILPFINFETIRPNLPAPLGPDGNVIPLTPDELAEMIFKSLKSDNTTAFNVDFVHKSFWDERTTVEFPKDEWKELFAQNKISGETKQFLLPLDYLDKRIKVSLEKAFQVILDPDLIELIERLCYQHNIPGGYRFLYYVVEKLRNERNPFYRNNSLNIYKLKYRDNSLQLLPVIEEIDARPITWVQQANSLSIERALAKKRVKNLFDSLNSLTIDTQDNFYMLSEELRQANRILFEINKNIELLRDELSEAGWQLLEGSANEFNIAELSIGRRWIETWVTYIPRQRVETWTEQYRERRCFLFFCENVYRSRTRSNVVNWLEAQQNSKEVSELIKVEWRPVENYLSGDKSQIPPPTYTVYDNNGGVDAAKTDFIKKLIAKALNQESMDNVKNKAKDVRIFSLYDNSYRDQYGFSLESVLLQAEDETTRAKLLLIIPILERQFDGSLETVKYLAVHNPIAPRKEYVQPRIFLVETFSHQLEQIPGHWLGSLSHTVCLFPGETRRVKLVSETRLVTQQKLESRSTRRSAIEQKNNVRTQVKSDLSTIRKDAKKSNWSANVSGGVNFGFWNVGGGGGGGEEKSSSEESAAQYLNDQISESMRNISDSNEVQFVNVSDSTLTENSSSEEIIEFQNVNQGRSVTHKFFQILNKYKSSIFLRDLKIVIEYGERLIPGYDIYRTESFRLDEINQIFPNLIKEDRERLINRVIELIKLRISKKVNLVENEGKLTFSPTEIKEPSYWFVNSGSYFVDTEVSRQPATEPYVNDARNAEIDLQKAKAERIRQEGVAIANGKLVFPTNSNSKIVVNNNIENEE